MSLAAIALNRNARPIASLSARKKRTLVVDDSATILHAICALLEHHEVVEIVGRLENGRDTIDAVLELQPELVLLDADMPGMSGLRIALLISQMHAGTEIVLMSMDTSDQFQSACAACGADAMIYKPKFLRELRAYLAQSREKSRTASRVGA
ncbi:MAG: response regulator [Candidatus Angelobacter sp.]